MLPGSAWTQIWMGLKWLIKALVFLFAFAAILLPLILMATSSDGRYQIPTEAGTAWLALVGVMMSFFLIYLAWRVIRGLFLSPFGSWHVFGSTTSARLVALGITALVTPKSVAAMLMIPANFLLQLLNRLPNQATRLAISVQSTPNSTYSIKEPVIQLAFMIRDVFATVAAAFSGAIEGILIPDLIIALGMWAVIGSLLSSTHTEADETLTGLGAGLMFRYVKALSPKQRYGIILTIILVIGAYLSIAAMVAIPWLHEEKVPQGLDRENLEKMLTSILPSTSAPLEERLRSLSFLDQDPLEQLSKTLSDRPIPKSSIEVFMLDMLKKAVEDSKNTRTRAISQFRQMPADIARYAEKMRQAALNSYVLETAMPMSTLERSYFVRMIQGSVSEDYADMDRKFRDCATALSDTDRQVHTIAERWSTILRTQVADKPAVEMGERDQKAALFASDLSNQLSLVSQSLRSSCETPVAPNTFYVPPEPGIGWGPFGLVARWLLRTKSLALTLITGMLGFGLLGSAISTSVRARNTEVLEETFAGEITSVVIRGLSAAIVVFLSVKGGLAVFATSDGEPNAYVLFFTCLVGAVFSEDVWHWARNKFIEKLNLKTAQTKADQTRTDFKKLNQGTETLTSKKEELEK